jgi:hypothetical protein
MQRLFRMWSLLLGGEMPPGLNQLTHPKANATQLTYEDGAHVRATRYGPEVRRVGK